MPTGTPRTILCICNLTSCKATQDGQQVLTPVSQQRYLCWVPASLLGGSGCPKRDIDGRHLASCRRMVVCQMPGQGAYTCASISKLLLKYDCRLHLAGCNQE